MTRSAPRISGRREGSGHNTYRFWSARYWHGMEFPAYLRLLVRNRARVSPRRFPLAISIFWTSLAMSGLAAIQGRRFGRRLASVEVPDPIFILGHWRSGTTLLHELLALDERFAAPTYADAIIPRQFLVLGPLIRRLRFLIPAQRPMDEMSLSLASPAEDETALFNRGLPSPYLTIAFPNEPPADDEYFDLETVTVAERERWKAGLVDFLRGLTYERPARLLLKSPTHTGRIRILLELFPNARFVHIVRDPDRLFASTKRLWQALYETQSLQLPNHDGLEEYILRCFERMYGAFEAQRGLIPEGRIVDLRYEDLVRDPVAQLRIVYGRLELGGFEEVEPAIRAYFAKRPDYRTNPYVRDPAVDAAIDGRWRPFMSRYGYASRGAPAAGAD